LLGTSYVIILSINLLILTRRCIITRVSWQERYAVAIVTSLTDSWPDFASSEQGIETGKFVIPVTEHPHLNPGASTLENEMALGLSERHTLEYSSVAAEPSTVTLTMPASPYSLSFFMGLLFQQGANEVANSTDKVTLTCSPYTSADPENGKYCSIVRQLSDAGIAIQTDVNSHVIKGAICTSLTISGEEGQLIMLSADMMGYAWATANASLLVTGATTTTWGALDVAQSFGFYKYEDIKMAIGTDITNATDFKTPSFSVTISNNAKGQYYNNTVLQKMILGRLTGEGTFRIPWGATSGTNTALTDFKDGVNKVLTVYYGDSAITTQSAEGEFTLGMALQYTDTDFGGEDEIGTDMSFSMVRTATEAAIDFKIAYASATANRGW